MLAAIAVLAAVLIAALLAWRTGRMAQTERDKVTATMKAVQAARDAERLATEANARPGEPLVERLRVEPAVVGPVGLERSHHVRRLGRRRR